MKAIWCKILKFCLRSEIKLPRLKRCIPSLPGAISSTSGPGAATKDCKRLKWGRISFAIHSETAQHFQAKKIADFWAFFRKFQAMTKNKLFLCFLSSLSSSFVFLLIFLQSTHFKCFVFNVRLSCDLQAVLIGSPQPIFTPTTVDYGRRGRRTVAVTPTPQHHTTIRDLDMDLMMGIQ